MSRKFFLSVLCIFFATASLFASPPVIHMTDLFRAPDDPDDHIDLATDFALAKRGVIDLKCVLIDYPPVSQEGNPDVGAVAQLQFLTRVTPYVSVGQQKNVRTPQNGLLFLKHLLEESPEPVIIHVLGANDSLAMMGELWPELLRRKVRAVYLNSGAGIDDEDLEYNVWLSPQAYRKMFSLPCPVYWIPCFHRWNQNKWMAGKLPSGQFGSYWRLPLENVFNAVRPEIQNYFIDALTAHSRKGKNSLTDSHWLNVITGAVDKSARSRFSAETRSMFCTAGLIHAAGLTVWKDGTLARSGEAPEKEVFRFRPVIVNCGEDARTTWKLVPEQNTRCYMIEITDVQAYPAAMEKALLRLLSEL